jgi:hypothetical protein
VPAVAASYRDQPDEAAHAREEGHYRRVRVNESINHAVAPQINTEVDESDACSTRDQTRLKAHD